MQHRLDSSCLLTCNTRVLFHDALPGLPVLQIPRIVTVETDQGAFDPVSTVSSTCRQLDMLHSQNALIFPASMRLRTVETALSTPKPKALYPRAQQRVRKP
jgi:hypothetical protein